MSVVDPAEGTAPIESVAKRRSAREAQRYGTIVVVGGGCYGSYYVRQLGRAAAAGALVWERLLVVDRDPDCRVAREARSGTAATPGSVAPESVVSEWDAFFRRHLRETSESPTAGGGDAIVPSPLMPHLMFEWLVERARERWPHRSVETAALGRPPRVPWARPASDGTHYVSFAEWMCPINCIEPRMCPATGGERTWSLSPAMRDYVAEERARGVPLVGPLLFRCTHRAYGVGMIDTADVVAADRRVAEAGTAGPAEVLVGTVSHCHGAVSRLSVGA